MSAKVFGYGSLVNRGTLPPTLHVERGIARGFRRAWRTRSPGVRGGACSLSIVPAADGEIEGLILTFDDAEWPMIRAREHNYNELRLADQPDVVIFRAKTGIDGFGDRHYPIFLSYVETTLQGFFTEFGDDGARRFMETTDGWHVPIIDARAGPRYPRAQQLSDDEQLRVDELLKAVDATILRPQEQRLA